MSGVAFAELVGVRKTYPGVVAADGVDLALGTGEVLGLVGKNGAGKSTVIKILAGLVDPDSGEIRVGGETVQLRGPQDAARRGLAFVHQELELIPRMTVADSVFLGLDYPKLFAGIGGIVDLRELRKRARAVLDTLGATYSVKAQVDDLTVAEKRLLMIARGLAQDARAIVLDEPTASLTGDEIEQLFTVIRGLRERGISVIYVSHRLEEILTITDRVAVMRDGRVVDEAVTSTLDRDQLVAKIAGTDPDAASAPPRRAPRSNGDSPVVLSVNGIATPNVVTDVSFEVRKGEILGLAGLVGAGRTEIARALFGIDPVLQGTVELCGKQVTFGSPADALAKRIVMLPEERKSLGNVTELSIRENTMLPNLRRVRRTPGLPFPSRRKENDVVTSMIKELAIKTDTAELPVAKLSGGNQQKVVLAKWLVHGADVFVFDEPTHGIDVAGKEDVYRVLEQLADEGKAIVFISSEFPELLRISDRIVVIAGGRSVETVDGRSTTEEELIELCYGNAA